ncbi:Filamentous hemagglutinin outer membrane protein (fragment) [Hyella patelloides LEGE 07179]|uniref:Filamentous hemagglutinin outer membrane protein n=1 Tax=Hyella patelloides LEGE 07179 TaxID=945734 RepID=A0A563W2A1_9CYAN
MQQASTDVAIQMNEEFQTAQLANYAEVQMYGQAPSVAAISERLGELSQQTGKKAAFINISLQSNQLEVFTVLPTVSSAAGQNSSVIASNKINSPEAQNTLRRTIQDTSRKEIIDVANRFRQEVSDVRQIKGSNYLESSQQLYKSLIAPIEKELEANDIDILVFSMDTGLRLLPIAALHDGEQFLIEKYALALVPSFGLTDTRYVNLSEKEILAMGASQFSEQTPLPAMPMELESVTRTPRQGEIYLNEDFTVANFKAQNSRSQNFSIIHLGTHAEFKSGNSGDSYIQFYDERLGMSELRDLTDELGWNSADSIPVELLVLSACQTATGDENAELGFAGLAVQAGVKSALASLWYVSDLGTLALMSEFYDQLSDTLIKAEALRQTQLQMLKEEVKISQGQINLSNGENLNLPQDFPQGDLSMAHPYFWSSFTLIGNWN